MNPVTIFLGVLFLAAGTLFSAGKLLRCIPAWQQMPAEEREKIRIRPLCRNIGTAIQLAGLLFLMNGVWPAFRGRWFSGAMIVWLAAAAFDVRRIGRSSRYRKE